jgi:ubiquinone/menaquinone biosynthesis C-methylase UbiE
MDDSYTGHHKGNSTERLLDKKAILGELNIAPGQTVLDAGCGDGYMAREFSRALGGTGKVYALDRPPEAVAALRRASSGTNITLIESDVTRHTGIADASVDLIYLSTVFHIFSDEQKRGFREEAERLLRPGGKLAIVEIEKRQTPLGPPQDMRVSPEELRQSIGMKALSLVKVGEYFYMQTFEKGSD